jgi:hypothetical protein
MMLREAVPIFSRSLSMQNVLTETPYQPSQSASVYVGDKYDTLTSSH